MKTIRKGFLINFVYEGSYIIYKLLAFCAIFFVVQFSIGFAVCKNEIEIMWSNWRPENMGYLQYDKIFNESIMPYSATAFLVMSFFGIYYIFKKDTIGANKLNAIYTLPYPRYCNFYAKLFYCILCPISVYATQALVNLSLIQIDYREITFRDNELFLSGTYDGIYQYLFTPNPVAIWAVLVMIYIAIEFFSDNVLKSMGGFRKGPNVLSVLSTIAVITSVNLMFNTKYIQNEWVYLYAISVCVVFTVLDLISVYRKVKV